MPPKKPAAKAAGGPSKKTESKQKDKIIEDKTFGMKNKKGNKQQKFIKMVTTQVQHGGPKAKRDPAGGQPDRAKLKEEKRKAAEELNLLFKPVEQKVAKGVDPKSVVCAFFKQDLCKKGDKCKFSHDLNIGRRSEKRNMYEDTGSEDTMLDWDESKLEDVVNEKHGESNKSLPATSIICKYFLDAVENNKYGWFWQCPTGQSCHYRHALPPGFVLKKDLAKLDKGPEISLEDLIEKERAGLASTNLTKVTLASFLKWKARKKREKIANFMAETEKKKADFRTGNVNGISGREMFQFNPDLVGEDDAEADNVVYENADEKDDDEAVHEINLESLAAEATDARVNDPAATTSSRGNPRKDGESSKLDAAVGTTPAEEAATQEAIAMAIGATLNGGADEDIDEGLFDGDDLDLVEEELETLELDD